MRPRTLRFLSACLWIMMWSPVSAQGKAPTDNKHYQKRTFQSEDGGSIDCWIMSPKNIDSAKRYPLVLSLHGRGGNTTAATVLGSAALRDRYPCFVIAPVSTKQGNWLTPRTSQRKAFKAMLPAAIEAMDLIMKEHPIDPDRVYVTGQSMGAVGTFGAIATRPETFAAAIPVAGGWDPEDAEKMKGVPIWVFHGDRDKTVPTQHSRDMVKALRKAGANPKYTEYKNVGHDSWSKAYADPKTWRWLFHQTRVP